MPNVHFSFRRGAGDVPEILYGKVEIKPTLAFARGTSLVLPAPTTLDLVNGEATANNVYPTPAPVAGQVEWAYRVKAIDTRGQSFEWMVGVPDSTGTVEFTALPRYFETKPPLFGKGEKGDPGEAATIQIGTTSSGTTPSVTNSGTNQAAILNFVLPKGDKGDRGDGVPAGGTALQYLRKDAAGAVTEWATLDKASVGLSNVDNTADADKPVSTPTSEALDSILDNEDTRITSLIADQASSTAEELGRRYYKNDGSLISVKDFGAIGDGVADDTQAVQNAVNYALGNFGGGTVYFPSGAYVFAGFVELGSNIRVLGTPKSVLVKPSVRTSVAFFALRSNGGAGYGSGGDNILIEGITTQGRAWAGESATLLSAHHATNVTVKDCTGIFSVARGHWIDLNGCKGVLVDNVTVAGAGISSDVPGEAIQVDISRPGSMSVQEDNPSWYDGLPSREVKVVNSRFLERNYNSVKYPAPVPFGSHTSPPTGVFYEDVTFAYNYCEPVRERTSGVRGVIHFISSNNINVTNNIIDLGGVNVRAVGIEPGYGGTEESTPEMGNGIVNISNNIINNYVGTEQAIYVIDATLGIVAGNTITSNGKPSAGNCILITSSSARPQSTVNTVNNIVMLVDHAKGTAASGIRYNSSVYCGAVTGNTVIMPETGITIAASGVLSANNQVKLVP